MTLDISGAQSRIARVVRGWIGVLMLPVNTVVQGKALHWIGAPEDAALLTNRIVVTG